MGNCQATDAATLVLQHPCGKVERFYWPMSAREVMKTNPGHYVALLISTTLYHSHPNNNDKAPQGTSSKTNVNPVRLTRIKLLRPTDTLLLGHVYRLITTQEVMKGLYAKKHAKMKKSQQESDPNEKAGQRSEPDKQNKVSKHDRQRARSTTSNNTGSRSKTWQPSLQSISEAAS
ncbi:hypothetical protein J1N35_019848 [Gossypium stocksii]|uniref:Uncharacterized protein n=1 Tax=Gossypium stocksii TaxID=47602 RepID=A0A9D3VD78_9ROSI|nr:hypothetical protein J1N35_019848 [Gossypium stocksii]